MRIIPALLMIFIARESLADCINYANPENEFEYTLKMMAKEDNTLAKKLISNGLAPNYISPKGASMFVVSAMFGDIEIFKWHLKNKVNLNIKNCEGISAVFAAAQWQRLDVLELLLASGANPNTINNNFHIYNTPLLIAVANNRISIVKTLVKYNAQVSFKNEKGLTAKSLAIDKGFIEILNVLNSVP